MGIRFIHTADFQIGKGFSRFPADIAAALRAARLETVKRIAAFAKDRMVDAVLVAGDCFDDIAVADETLRRFKIALEAFDGLWVLLPGNHDPAIAESPWSRLKALSLPENVMIADHPVPIPVSDKAVILPAPLRRRRDAADLTDWFDAAATGDRLIRIGLAHGSVRDFLPEASEAANPIASDRAERARLDYLALGDWHGRLQVSQRAWYSGTPEPDRFRTNESGYVLDVSIESAGALPRIEAIPTATYQWIHQTLNIMPGGGDHIGEAVGAHGCELAHLVLRLELQGTVDLATRQAVNERLNDLAARVLHLERDESQLIVEPTDDDLDVIDTAGFVRVAMNRLREKLQGPDAAIARRALALLYGLHCERCE